MPTPEPAHAHNKWSDEVVFQPAGEEGRGTPSVENEDPGDLSGVAMPPATRYLDETGEVPTNSSVEWQSHWIEDA